jgi:DNA adenine methylase
LGNKEEKEMVEEYKGVRQAFGSPGGKSYLAPRIATMLPPHKIYVEPFVGGGAVFYRKYPSEVEVLNDKDTEIIFANRFMRDMSSDDFGKLKKLDWVGSKSQFDKVKNMQPKTDMERFYKHLYLKSKSFAKGMSAYDDYHDGKSTNTDKFWQCHERLNKVKLNSGDYMKMIEKYDSPDTLFYLDPPYPDRAFVGGDKTFGDAFTNEKLKELLDKLDKVKGKFIVSLGTNSEPLIPKHWKLKRVKVRSFMAHGDKNTNQGYRMEIMVSKQPLKEYPQAMASPSSGTGFFDKVGVVSYQNDNIRAKKRIKVRSKPISSIYKNKHQVLKGVR